jgi:hypothetical protein
MAKIAGILISAVLPILVSVALIVMGASTPGEFLVVRGCVVISGVVIFVLTVWGLTNHADSVWHFVLGAAVVASLAVGMPIIFRWIDQKELIAETKTPKNVGTLVIDTGRAYASRPLEIGDSHAIFGFTDPNAEQSLGFLKALNLKLEVFDGKISVTAQIKDQQGRLVAELIRNEWTTAPNPQAWDRNYNDNTLEVKNSAGRIALQVRLLPDRVQLQGEWWDTNHGYRMVASDDPSNPGGFILIFGGPKVHPEDPPFVKPLFVYPSDLHFGELVK